MRKKDSIIIFLRMEKKYQIFISSTYVDLIEERDVVTKAILEMGHIPVGMEMFSAGDEQQWQIIQRQIDVSDYYIVIMAHRYGSLDGSVSYTEKEYDYAKEKSVPVLAFVIEDDAVWPQDRGEKEAKKQKKLREFKKKASSKYISRWTSKDDLYGKVSIALTKQMTSRPMIGWIRANEVAGPEVTQELSRLSRENSDLRNKLSELEKIKDANFGFDNLAVILSGLEFEVSYTIYSSGPYGHRDASTDKLNNNINCLYLFRELAPKISRIVKSHELVDLINKILIIKTSVDSIEIESTQSLSIRGDLVYEEFISTLTMYDILVSKIESIVPANNSQVRYSDGYSTIRYLELSSYGKRFYQFIVNL